MLTDRSRCLEIGGSHGVTAPPNRPQSIRTKIGAWRLTMSRKRVFCKKFFCCQNHDSESLRLASKRLSDASWGGSQRNRSYSEYREMLQYKCFLHSCKETVDRACASIRARFGVASMVAHRARTARGVNTSLSGKLFFLSRWCIRDGVHLDSRVHAAIRPSHIGGQHG
jgi:hypothetical protein